MAHRPAPCVAGTTGRGFTLIEVLVAMLVLAIMAVMSWQGIDGIVRARESSQTRLETTLRLNAAIGQWEQDLASIQDSGVTPAQIACDGATVRLTRRTPTGLQVVAWSLRPNDTDPSAGGTWVRWAGPSVTTRGELTDSWLRSLQLQGSEPGSVQAQGSVLSWQVFFFQGTNWANCGSTGNVAAASGVPAVQLPKGVRVLLNFVPGTGLAGSLLRDVQIGS